MSQNITFCDVNPFEKGFINITKQYLNTPYLWGGRTSIGIDCSGFTQIIYRLFNIHLPRDAHQQAKVGSITKNIKLGDIAFFEKESKINHVGIILNNNQIIHASGKVRIDSIDSKGIFNKELNLYTHHLKYIKKILN
jgi:cell wall-associated NlpC family hydrolase